MKRNREYWIQKIEENMVRDRRDDELLEKSGWKVLHFWEKQVLKDLDYCVELVMYYIRNSKLNMGWSNFLFLIE